MLWPTAETVSAKNARTHLKNVQQVCLVDRFWFINFAVYCEVTLAEVYFSHWKSCLDILINYGPCVDRTKYVKTES